MGSIREHCRKGLCLSQNDGSYILPAGQRRELVQREQQSLSCIEVHGTLSKNEQVHLDRADYSTATGSHGKSLSSSDISVLNTISCSLFYNHCFQCLPQEFTKNKTNYFVTFLLSYFGKACYFHANTLLSASAITLSLWAHHPVFCSCPTHCVDFRPCNILILVCPLSPPICILLQV